MIKGKEFHIVSPFTVKSVTTPPHDPNTTSTGDGEVIKIAGYSNYAGNIEAGEAFVDLCGDVVNPSGIDVSTWKDNPQILLQHDRHATIGRGLSVVKKKDGLYIEAEIHAGACSEEDFYRIKSGLLSYLSIGFRTLESEYKKIGDKQVFFIKKSLLLEISVVGIPACGKSSFQVIKSLPGGDGFYAGELGEPINKESGDSIPAETKGEEMELTAEQIKALAAAVAVELKAIDDANEAVKAAKAEEEKAMQEEVDRRVAEERAAAEKAAQEEAEKKVAEEAEAKAAQEEAEVKAVLASTKAFIEETKKALAAE